MSIEDEAFETDYTVRESPSRHPAWTAEQIEAAGIDYTHVWTVVDSDRSTDLLIIPGWHVVNRVHYVVTEQPWLNLQQEYVWFSDPEEEFFNLQRNGDAP